MSVKKLPSSTVKLIGSSQVITSVSSAVKELVENSIDAGASSIDIKLDNFGLNKIEVKDDGHGIPKPDVVYMCQRSYTSKIQDFSDLESLSFYGFRGEALNALCTLGQVTVTTITSNDDLAISYTMDSCGFVKLSKPSHLTKGTILSVENLFHTIPVRRQQASSARKRNEELHKVESVVKSLAVIHPNLKVTIAHSGCTLWVKARSKNLLESLSYSLQPTVTRQLDVLIYSDDSNHGEEFEFVLPKIDCNISTVCFGSSQDATKVYVNLRPVTNKAIEKGIQSELFQYFGNYIPNGKFPFSLVSVKISPAHIDVNLEPNKTRVLIKDLDSLILKLKKQIREYYSGIPKDIDEKKKLESETSKRKISDECLNDSQSKVMKVANEEMSTFDSESIIADVIDRNKLQSISFSDDVIATSTQKELRLCGNDGKILKASSSNSGVSKKISEFLHAEGNKDHHSLGLSISESQEHEVVNCGPSREQTISIFLDSLIGTNENQESPESKEENYNADMPEFKRTLIDEVVTDEIHEGPSYKRIFDVKLMDKSVPDVDTSVIFEKASNLPGPCCSEAFKDNVHLDINDITLSQWSKGHVSNNCSEFIQNCSILTNIQNNQDSSVSDRIPYEDQSISSQLGMKHMSAFNKFARDAKPKILEENPGLSFVRVASELASRWKSLHNDEREKYEIIAKDEKKMREEKRKQPTDGLINAQLPFVKMIKETDKRKKKIDYNKIKFIDISLDAIERKHLLDGKSKMCTDDPVFCFLTNDLALIHNSNTEELTDSNDLEQDITVCCCSRLAEVISFYKNMATMSIPTRVLETCIKINNCDLGNKYWECLSSLETCVDINDGRTIINHEAICKNGFRIEVEYVPEGKEFCITDVAVNISYFGIDDLKECLELIITQQSKCGVSIDLACCRPLKVASYIRSETARDLSKSNIITQQHLHLNSKLNFYFSKVQPLFPKCPHHKPIVKCLHKW